MHIVRFSGLARRAALVTLLAALGCDQGAELDQAQAPLNNGGLTSARPEIGQIFLRGRCTATLIAPQFVLTASHCNLHRDDVPTNSSFVLPDGTSRAVTRIKILGAEDIPIDRMNPDVAIVQLDQPIPASVATPAPLSSVPPRAGDAVTVFGSGCNKVVPSRDGRKQFVSWTYGQRFDQTCPGDSGGPAVFGGVNGGGAIWGVNSFNDGKGDVWGGVPRFKDQILQIMLRWSSTGGDEVGIDRPGMDLVDFQAPGGLAECKQACIGNADCRAYTFTAAGRCWLKRAIPDWVPCPTCTSGIRPTRELNTDRPGGDYADFDLPEDRPELCLERCGRERRCKAYTFTSAGFNGSAAAHCWLKETVPPPVGATGGVSSGVKADAEKGVDRPGFNLKSMSASSKESCAESCANEHRCRAYVFGNGTCWLKSAVPPPVANAAFVSGVRRGIEVFTDRPGSDIGSPLTLEPPFVEKCQAACAARSDCRAFTMVYKTPDVLDNNALCFLKSAIPQASSFSLEPSFQRVFSGMKGATFF